MQVYFACSFTFVSLSVTVPLWLCVANLCLESANGQLQIIRVRSLLDHDQSAGSYGISVICIPRPIVWLLRSVGWLSNDLRLEVKLYCCLTCCAMYYKTEGQKQFCSVKMWLEYSSHI